MRQRKDAYLNMEKNTLLAILLSTAFLIFWYSFAAKNRPGSVMEKPSYSAESHPEEAKKTDLPETKEIKTAGLKAKEVLVETPHVRIVFNTRSAGITKWEIKDISGWVDLVMLTKESLMPLETFPGITFLPSVNSLNLTAEEESGEISFTALTDDGVHITKTFHIDARSYMAGLDLALKNTGRGVVAVPDWSIGWGPGLNTTEREQKENSRHLRSIGFGQGKLVKLRTHETHSEVFKWAAIDNRYFLAALIPIDVKDYTCLKASTEKKSPPSFSWHASTTLLPGEEKT
ncbi:MAG: membrane protein insertase YidC, partial [bacterium]